MMSTRLTRASTARLQGPLVRLPSMVRCLSQTPHPEASHNEIKEFPQTYNHYQILGVSPSADKKEIKSAFRKLSKRFHPDVNQRVPTALKPIIKNNYIRIVSSYETLSNQSKRTEYDSSMKLSSRNNNTFSDNASMYSPTSKQYSAEGINITRNRVHFGPGYRRSRSKYANMDINTPPSGSNYDVPHFDYDSHLKGNLWFERRMIQKRFIKTSKITPNEEQKNEWFHEKFQNHNKKTVKAEMNDTLNLQRYGGHYHRGQASYTITATPLLLTGLTILTMGVYLH